MDPMRVRRDLLIRAAVFLAGALVILYYLRHRRTKRARITYGPMSDRDIRRNDKLASIYGTNDVECQKMLRLKRGHFFALCSLLRERALLNDSIHCCVEEQVAMFLHTIGHNQRNRVVGKNFYRSGETVSRYFRQVLHAIGELRHELIKPPTSQTPQKILGSRRWYPYFKDCIGAIDGTHIRVSVPKSWEAAFRGRKGFITQNVMAAVDFDLRFKKKTGVIFDEESCMITMSTDQYMQHVQDYPGDENFINTPLEHYSYLATVFGNMMATGAHAKAATEALAPDVVNEDPADDHVSVEPSIETSSTSAPSKNVQGSGSSSDKGKNKRAREDSNASIDPIVSTITDSLKLLANAISSSAQCLPVDLWDQVQCLPGFSELEKTNFYIYLSDRPSLANAFSKIPLANKVIWMDKFTHEDMP